MVFCSLCKQSKETTYKWRILDHTVSGKQTRYRICDDCASFLLREMTRRIMGIREIENMPDPTMLSKTGVISDMLLHEDQSLELVIDLDICKAKRWVCKQQKEEIKEKE